MGAASSRDPSGTVPPMRLHFVRDGSAVGAEGRCIGHTDLQLSANGRMECRALAHGMPDVPLRLISSDLRRAQATALLLSSEPITTEPRLREMDFGAWDGKSWSELDLEQPVDPDDWSDHWPSIRTPGGESFEDVIARVTAWLDSLPRDSGEFLVVAHAGSIRAAAVALLGISASRAFSMALDHATVSTFELSTRGATLIRWNSSGF